MKTQEHPVSQAIKVCRMCGHGGLESVIDLGHQYVANFVREKDESLPKADLHLVKCKGCGLLQLKHSVDRDILWRGDYWYRSGVNQTMSKALSDVVQDASRYVSRGTWLDIGANDGTLLSKVPSSFQKIGCEPSPSLHSLLEEHCDRIVPEFFSEGVVDEPCDVITSCAMFYDLDQPGVFCEDIANLLTKDGIWVNQLSDASALVHGNAWDGICHEHRTYWDMPQLEALYAHAGLKIVDVSTNDVNGGSVRITARKGEMTPNQAGGVTEQELADFALRIPRWKQLMGWMLDSMELAGRSVYGYAASTKACTLLQYLDRNASIRAIADRNPIKFGTVMAGTWIPVIDEDTMRKEKPDVLIGLAWAFKKEFIKREKDLTRAGTSFLFPLPNPEWIL